MVLESVGELGTISEAAGEHGRLVGCVREHRMVLESVGDLGTVSEGAGEHTAGWLSMFGSTGWCLSMLGTLERCQKLLRSRAGWFSVFKSLGWCFSALGSLVRCQKVFESPAHWLGGLLL